MERRNSFNRPVSLVLDLLAAPASQAYVERVFSLCGYLTGGKRNRMEKSLEMRAFLKMNGLLSVAVAVELAITMTIQCNCSIIMYNDK